MSIAYVCVQQQLVNLSLRVPEWKRETGGARGQGGGGEMNAPLHGPLFLPSAVLDVEEEYQEHAAEEDGYDDPPRQGRHVRPSVPIRSNGVFCQGGWRWWRQRSQWRCGYVGKRRPIHTFRRKDRELTGMKNISKNMDLSAPPLLVCPPKYETQGARFDIADVCSVGRPPLVHYKTPLCPLVHHSM